MGNWLLRHAGSGRDGLQSRVSFEHFETAISKLSKILTKQQDRVRGTHSLERGAGARGTRTDTHRHPFPMETAGQRGQLEV